MEEPVIITREQAIKAGLRKYYTGKPCPKGHLAEKYVTGACVECARLQRATDKTKQRMREYYLKHKDDPDYQAKVKANRELYKQTDGFTERDRFNQQQFRRTARSKNWYLTKKYGITYEQKQQMIMEQNNRCAICGDEMQEEDGKASNAACLDHCHTSGVIRGILCSRCNKGLGCFRDNVEYMQKAIEYLTTKKET